MFDKLFSLALCVLLMGCAGQTARENVSASLIEVERQQDGLRATWKGKKSESLTWKRAVALLEDRNLNLKRSSFRLQELLGERKHFAWRQLDPRLIAYANFNTVLGDLSALSSDGFGASLLGSVNIPDPVGYYGRRYALELQYYRNLLDHEKLERDLKASLYDLFVTQNELDQLSRENAIDEAKDYKSILMREARAIQVNNQNRNRYENLRLRVNGLLDTPGANYRLESSTLPNISYASKMSRLDSKKGYGRLAIYQLAGQLEVANARLWQVKYSKLPRIGSGVSLPALYQNEIDNNFQYEDVALFTSLNRTIEFTGRRKRNELRERQQVEHVRRTTISRMEQEIVRFEQSKRTYRLLVKEAEYLQKQLKFLRNNPPNLGVKTMIEHVKELEEVKRRADLNKRRLQRLELRFWVWDDQYWGLPF